MNLLLREAVLAFRRAPLLSLLSVTAIAFSLYTVGLFGLVALNLRQALQQVEERVEIVAFLLRGTPEETVTTASQDISVIPGVEDVTYVSSEDALARARRELIEFRDAYRDLAVNPLPPAFEVRLKPGYRDAVHVGEIASILRGFAFVEDVRYGRDWVSRLDQLRNVAAAVGLVTGVAFAIVAIVIIGVTIRLTILQRAREIAIMRVVGATNQFIRGPFLLEGGLKGLMGGMLALLLAFVTLSAFKGGDGPLAALTFFTPAQSVVLIVFGVMIGLLGSLVSVGRHLRAV